MTPLSEFLRVALKDAIAAHTESARMFDAARASGDLDSAMVHYGDDVFYHRARCELIPIVISSLEEGRHQCSLWIEQSIRSFTSSGVQAVRVSARGRAALDVQRLLASVPDEDKQ